MIYGTALKLQNFEGVFMVPHETNETNKQVLFNATAPFRVLRCHPGYYFHDILAARKVLVRFRLRSTEQSESDVEIVVVGGML